MALSFLLLLLLLLLASPRAARAQATCATPYSFRAAGAGAGGGACCPAPGATFVSAALGCRPDATVGGPADTAFFFSGAKAEGVAGFTSSGGGGSGGGGAAPAFVADRLGNADGALSTTAASAQQLTADSAALRAVAPSGAGPMSAAAWVKCAPQTTTTTATATTATATTPTTTSALSWGTPSAVAQGSPTTRFGVAVTDGSGAPFELVPSIVRTAAGSAVVGLAQDDIGTSATFNGPYGVAGDERNGLLYVIDTSNNKIRKIVLSTRAVTTVAGNGSVSTPAFAGDGLGTSSMFSGPRAGIVGPGGELYVADTIVHRVRVVYPNGTVATVSGTGTRGSQDGVGTSATHTGPCAFAFDSGWTLYVSDYSGGQLRSININTWAVATVAGLTSATSSQTVASLDGVGTSATFTAMTGIVFVPSLQAIFGAEYLFGKIRKISLAPSCLYCVSTLTGYAQNISASGWSTDGTLATAQFAQPWAIAADSAGALYVAQYNVNNVRRIDIAGNSVVTVAGSTNCSGASALALCGVGTSGVGYIDNAVGTSARLNYLRGITFYAPTNTLFLPEQTGNRIRTISTSGPSFAVGTLAGMGITAVKSNAGETDGAPGVATLTAPRQGVLDGSGNLLFVDSTNGVLRSMSVATGVVTTLVGGPTARSADGLGASAGFSLLSGITRDPSGNIYTSESTSNSRIRRTTLLANGTYQVQSE